MVLVHCMITAEILFLAPKFFFFTIRAERPFVLKVGYCSQQCTGASMLHEANASIGNNFLSD